MARIPRKNMNDSSFFHIMVQGINKEYIFDTKRNIEKYLELIYKNNEGVTIIAYCIMNNHAHFLVQTNFVENIERWMRKSNTSYAMYYNKKNERVGYVYRNRYKVQTIKHIEHLYLCIDYIHDNPVKAGMVKHRKEYEFSSYTKLYLGNQNVIIEKLSKILEQDITNKMTKDQRSEENFKLIEEDSTNKEEICNDIIEKFLKENDFEIVNLKKNRKMLKLLINMLKDKNDISYRMMEKYLKIGRETLRKIANEN